MKQKELTKIFMMILYWKRTIDLWKHIFAAETAYDHNFQFNIDQIVGARCSVDLLTLKTTKYFCIKHGVQSFF